MIGKRGLIVVAQAMAIVNMKVSALDVSHCLEAEGEESETWIGRTPNQSTLTWKESEYCVEVAYRPSGSGNVARATLLQVANANGSVMENVRPSASKSVILILTLILT